MDISMESIGNRIKDVRIKKNMTHRDIYEKCGIASGAISMIENGKRVPSAIILYKIADALGVSVDWLITGSSTESENVVISELESALLDSFRELNSRDQEEILEIIEFKIHKSKKVDSGSAKSSHSQQLESNNKVG